MTERKTHSLSEDITDAARQTGMTPKQVTDYLLEVTEIIQGINKQIKGSDTDELRKLKDALEEGGNVDAET